MKACTFYTDCLIGTKTRPPGAGLECLNGYWMKLVLNPALNVPIRRHYVNLRWMLLVDDRRRGTQEQISLPFEV